MRFKIILFFIFLFSVFRSEAIEHKYLTIEDKSDLVILNPLLKNRKTLKLRLSNGLKVYIISDKNADKSAAAIGVLAGSWDDPKEFPGMAHFCEHMLFQGSKKYPNEADYFKFIWDNSGTLNAFTAPDRTLYMFSINHENFDAALDRLSHFFKDPVFDPSNIARELFAVDQEHSKNIENDARRVNMVSKEISNQKHPKAKFSTGNSKTLQSIPPAELRKWYETHYSSNQMALTIYSNLDLNDLKKMVVEKFSLIPNIGKDPLNIDENILSDENAGKMVYIKPISNLQILAMEWELNKKFTRDETKSAALIAYTLTRGQKNSLIENLKKEHLAEDLDVTVDKVGGNQSLLSIEVKLTDLGLQNISKVINRCFEAINNLKNSSIPSYLFHEMESMAKLNYEYQSHEDAFEFVSNNTINLLDEDISTYPKKTLLATNYSSENVLEIINSLTFSNAQFYLIADPKKTKVPLDSEEKWTKAKYTIKDLSPSLKTLLSKNLTNPNIKLPEPNVFIPSNVQIVTPKDNPTSPTNPAKIVSSDFGTIYYLKDDQYQVPQVSYLIQIKDKLFNGSTKAEVLKDIYIKALKEKISPTFYSAMAAGLFPNITSDSYHLKIEIFGYSQKASYLLEEILKEINNFEISKDDFDIYYSSIYKTYENNQTQLPVIQAYNYLYHVLIPSTSTFESKLDTLKNINYKDFIEFKNQLFKKTFIEGFLSGNLTLKQAESIWLDIKDILGQKPFYPKDHYKKEVFIIS
nr:Protease 3 [Candidatus Anoxychlamydiales bacterium]